MQFSPVLYFSFAEGKVLETDSLLLLADLLCIKKKKVST